MRKFAFAGIGLALGLATLYAAYQLAPLVWILLVIGNERRHPESIDWQSHAAWSKCEGAIAGKIPWPAASKSACDAMMMCANEAPLNDEQKAALAEAAERTPGCGAP